MNVHTASIVFSIDRVTGVRVAEYRGVVSDADVIAAYDSLFAEPGHDFALHDLVDLSGVERLEVSEEALRALIKRYAHVDELKLRTKLAIVAPSDLTFGIARMYELLRGDDVPEEIRIFRGIAEARAWLRRD